MRGEEGLREDGHREGREREGGVDVKEEREGGTRVELDVDIDFVWFKRDFPAVLREGRRRRRRARSSRSLVGGRWERRVR